MPILSRRGLIAKDPWTRIFCCELDYRNYPWFSIVPLQGLTDEQQWPLSQTWLGAWFEVTTSLENLRPAVLELPILNINIAQFNKRRIFSALQQLRHEYGYIREIRLSGDFPIDQMAQLVQRGVDSFELTECADLEHVLFVLRQTSERTE